MDKSNYLYVEKSEVSEYYKNYQPNPIVSWIKDTITTITVVFAVIFIYAVTAQILGSVFFGTDVSQAEIQQGFSNME